MALLIALWLMAGCSTVSPVAAVAPSDVTVVYLVRHAEKLDGSRDPGLSPAGHERALRLSQLLARTSVDRLWSSDFERTRATLRPLAVQQGLEITVYDARDSRGLVDTILGGGQGRVHVIAGHSNTVPELVDLLEHHSNPSSAEAARPLLGHDEYDRLYVITLGSGPVQVEERRY